MRQRRNERAGLRRLEVIEHAVAQAAGFGAKFLFIMQNLPQLKVVYNEGWETFVSNCGLKIFFQIDDDFTRSYASRLRGGHEVRCTTQSGSRSQSTSRSQTESENYSLNNCSLNTGTTSGSSSAAQCR